MVSRIQLEVEMVAGMSEEELSKTAKTRLEEMKVIAVRMRDLIAQQPPNDLLGYIYGQRLLDALKDTESEVDNQGSGTDPLSNLVDDTQFVLEYVHASLAATPELEELTLDEAACAEIFKYALKLRMAAMSYAMESSAGTNNGAFGPDTAEIEFHAKSNWILLRGNRYQVLEGEFYGFVLAPHDKLLRDTYGMGAQDIAKGFQDIANAVRVGQADAIKVITSQFDDAKAFAGAQGKSLEKAMPAWKETQEADQNAASVAIDDMFRGGICNVSRHTKLPKILLDDLAFSRGEESEFFTKGPFAGTPLQTLPARKKPLIKIDDNYYAVDPCFMRDSGYRALLFNLLNHRPDYKKEFEAKQKVMSEAAFCQIFKNQFKGAKINKEVWYKDPTTRQWVENDTLIRIDDVLFLVEAKAGAAATIASPAVDFPRHVQSIQDLVVKAYNQCKRFFEYLNSADEVPIFERKNSKYVECGRIRVADFRLLLPIGLTVESFSPFSTMCKELSEIEPILGKHAFLSLSIDDLFVLTRFLPTMGELAHYLEVRQAVAGIKRVLLFDELDHLGAYINNNRFDQVIAEQQAKDKFNMIVWNGMSKVVDHHFEDEDWETRPVPTQEYPDELLRLLEALNNSRAPGWLSVEAHIRNYSNEGRENLARILESCRATLQKHNSRYFQFIGEQSLFIWLQKNNSSFDLRLAKFKSSAAALAANTTNMIGIIVFADPKTGYESAKFFSVEVPTVRNTENVDIYADAEKMRTPRRQVVLTTPKKAAAAIKVPGQDKPCWCGSEIKYKECHGR